MASPSTVPPEPGSEQPQTDELVTQLAEGLPLPRFQLAQVPRLVVVSGGEPRSYELEAPVVIGRGREADIRLASAGISRAHARVYKEKGRYYVQDLGSRNGTFVNGARVDHRDLKVGDEIHIGAEAHLVFSRVSELEDKLVERQKMEAVGRLAAGVAHEYNNLLAIVLASLEYVSSLPDDVLKRGDILESLDDAMNAASQAATVTRSLLSFARPAGSDVESVDASSLINSVIQLVRRTFERSISFDVDAEPGMMVLADRHLLSQVVMNLCINARDAMSNGGRLTVRARRETTYDADKGVDTEAIVIEVSDTGVGMTEEQRRRIFEPFFSTKGEHQGTGLGLSLVYGAVRSHGGELEVRTAVGHGTTFVIRLPAYRPGDSAPPPSRDRKDSLMSVRPTVHHGLLLLVDDEPLVRRSCARALRAGGFEVVTVATGEEAVDVYNRRATEVSAVVLDLNMPGLSGSQTFDRLLRMNPAVKVIVLSGIADRERTALLEQGAAAVLSKPCPMDILIQSIRDSIRIR